MAKTNTSWNRLTRQACRAVATANVALAGTQTIDTVALSAGERVLLTGQTAPAENGPWVVAAGAWSRPGDYLDNSTQDPNVLFPVSEGTGANEDSRWQITTDGIITVGTTGTTWGRANVPATADVLAALASSAAAKDMGGGAVTNVGAVDGRDVSTDGTDQDDHLANTSNPHTTSITNIGTGSFSALNNAVTGRDMEADADKLDDLPENAEIIRRDGTVPFTATIAGVAPVAGADLVTKTYGDANYAGGGGGELFTVSNWLAGDQREFLLATALAAVGRVSVNVWLEVAQAAVTNADWSIGASEFGDYWEREDLPHAGVNITPSGTTGAITLTRSTGNWSAADVGMTIEGNSGVCAITAQDGTAVCDAVTSVDFASTALITADDWEFYSVIEDGTGQLALSSAAGDEASASLLVLSDHADGSTDIIDSTATHTMSLVGTVAHETDQKVPGYGASSIEIALGAGNYMVTDDHADFDFAEMADYTIEFWVRYKNSANSPLFCVGDGTLNYPGILIHTYGKIYASTDGTSWDVLGGTAMGLTANNWNHVCIMVTGGTLYCYTDGVLKASSGVGGGVYTGGQRQLCWGRWVPANKGAGAYYSEIRVSPAAIYNTAGFTIPDRFITSRPVTNAYAVAKTTVQGRLLSDNWTTLDAWNPVEVDVAGGASVYYAVTPDDGVTHYVWDAASSRAIARFAAVWEYNSNATYGSETWSAAATNTADGALREAMSVAANRMDKTQAQGNCAHAPGFGDEFGVAVIFHTTAEINIPKVSSVDFDYSGNVKQLQVPPSIAQDGSGWEIDHYSTDRVRVKAPDTGGPFNVRVAALGV